MVTVFCRKQVSGWLLTPPPGEGLLHALGTRIIWLDLSREGVL